MIPEEIKAKAIKLAAMYEAVGKGGKFEFNYYRLDEKTDDWRDPGNQSPLFTSDLSRWRVSVGPQRIWISGTAWTDSPAIAAALKEAGQETREFVEVLP